MSRPYVMAIVERSTEQTFIKKVLAPYLSQKGIDIVATQISKPGEKGGDVTFTRVVKDIKQFLRQPQITAITTMIDLYGLRDWPQKDKIFQQSDHSNRIDKLYNITQQALVDEFQEKSTKCIPYFSLYEFEALLFSNPAIRHSIQAAKLHKYKIYLRSMMNQNALTIIHIQLLLNV